MHQVGPAPSPDRSVWADPTRRRVLLTLAGAGGQTVRELAGSVGGHPNTTRGHLDALLTAGLVSRHAGSPADGRSGGEPGEGSPRGGRPPWVYTVTAVGRSAARRARYDDSPTEYLQLAAAFTEHAAGQSDPAGTARSVGRLWGAALAGGRAPRTVAGRRRLLLDVLDRVGFTPVELEQPWEATASAGPGGSAATLRITLLTCPLLEAARRHPEVVCEVHRGVMAGALTSAGRHTEDADVDLKPWGLAHGCPVAVPLG